MMACGLQTYDLGRFKLTILVYGNSAQWVYVLFMRPRKKNQRF
jgi:hypothetical protein